VLLDADGMIIDHAPRTGRVMGYANESLIGRDVLEMIHPEDRVLVRRVLNELLTGEAQGITRQFRALHRTGSSRWGEAVAANHLGDPEVRAIVVNYRDITDRKRAEEALRESEERLRLALDAAHMGTFDWDVPRNRTTWSRWHEELWGFKPGEFGGTYEAFSERVHHDDLPGINADIARCIAARELSVREFRVVWPDGSVHWMQSRGEFTFGDDGQPVRMRGVVVETTAHRLAEEALRTSEERLRVGLNTANIAVFNQDLDLRYIWMYQSQLGYTSEQVTGHTDAELLPPEAARQVMEIKRRVLESGLKEHAEVPVSVGGQTFVYDLVVEPLRDANSAIIGLTGASLDITEHKRAEAALQESEERFRQLSDAAFEAIILHDQGTILEVNQSFCRMYGYERAEVIGKSVLDLALPEFHELLLQKVRSGDTGPYEGHALRKDGTIFRAEVAGKPIHYQGRVVRVAAIRDITEQERNERRQAAQYAVTRVLAESATLAEATPQLLQVICESLRWKMGECWRVCDSTNLLRCVETWHVPALDATSFIEVSRQTELAPGVGLPGRVWQSGQPEWIPDVMTDLGFARAAIAAKVGLRGAVAFPILLGNHTLGLMLFFSGRSPEVDEDLLKIMSAIGSQIGQFTERKQIEKELRESEERYRDLVENSRELICTHDLNGVILSANRTASEVLGYDLKDCCGKKNYRDLLVPEVRDQFDDYLARIRRDGVASGLTLVQTSSGDRRLLEYHNTVRTEGVATPIVRGMARDITEQRRTEEAMSGLRRELELTMCSMEEGVHRVDLKGNIVFENPVAARMLGWGVAELLGKPAHLTMHHTRQDGTPYPTEECPIYATFRDGITRQVADEVFWRRDGTSFPVEYMTAPMRNDRNEIVATVVTFRDTTERKRAEAALRESEQEQRLFNLATNDMFWKWDFATDRVARSISFERAFGYSEHEITPLIGWWEERLHPDDQERVLTAFQTALKRGDKTCSYEYHFRRHDGSYATISDRAYIVRDENGKAVRAMGAMTDITERKRAEKSLRESEERYRELFENAKDAIYVHDLGGRYTSINRAAEKLSGFTREEILGKHFSNFVSPRDLKHVRINLCRKLDEENETIYEVDLVTRTGQRVPVEVSSRLIYESGVAVGIQGTARDITDRKRAQEALRIFSQRLIQVQEAERENIARELHDEIGQVLTAVKINLQSVQHTCQTADCVPRLDESIGIVDEALGRVRELSIELRPSLLDDLGLTAALRWYVDRYAQRTGIIAEVLSSFDEDGRLPRELETACFRIAQEALTNVARHAQAGSVSVQLERSRERMLLTVMDDGVGFDIDKLRKSASAASALGLRGMEERALAVGGHIEIDSGLERGTRVRATFPFKRK
jgi:PAS domain S-box-containing protein